MAQTRFDDKNITISDKIQLITKKSDFFLPIGILMQVVRIKNLSKNAIFV
jgi:hypothetical protein